MLCRKSFTESAALRWSPKEARERSWWAHRKVNHAKRHSCRCKWRNGFIRISVNVDFRKLDMVQIFCYQSLLLKQQVPSFAWLGVGKSPNRTEWGEIFKDTFFLLRTRKTKVLSNNDIL